MNKLLIAAALAVVAVGLAPPAGAAPKFCDNHEEYFDLTSASSHAKGSMYKTACAIGPGNGGNNGVTSDPTTWPVP